jgi:transcriptional regulator with PAS, ATPase and Fis domain
MADHSWVQEFPASLTVCDPNGIILEMNNRAVKNYQEQGGIKLLGTNMLDCHTEPARTKTQRLLEARQANVYTIEKRGAKKLIYQTPWFKDGKYCGFVELSLELPVQMPHFVRDA